MIFTEETIEKLRIININSDIYIGRLEHLDAASKVMDCVHVDRKVEEWDILNWFKQANLGSLQTIEVKGQVSISERDFPQSQKRYMKVCLITMNDVKQRSIKEYENKLFSSEMEA